MCGIGSFNPIFYFDNDDSHFILELNFMIGSENINIFKFSYDIHLRDVKLYKTKEILVLNIMYGCLPYNISNMQPTDTIIVNDRNGQNYSVSKETYMKEMREMTGSFNYVCNNSVSVDTLLRYDLTIQSSSNLYELHIIPDDKVRQLENQFDYQGDNIINRFKEQQTELLTYNKYIGEPPQINKNFQNTVKKYGDYDKYVKTYVSRSYVNEFGNTRVSLTNFEANILTILCYVIVIIFSHFNFVDP